MLKRVARFTTLLLACLLVLVALLLSGLRLWTPSLSRYHAEIEAAAGTALGAPVRFGQVEAGWRGLAPVLTLHDLRLAEPGAADSAPLVSELRVRPDVLHLLLAHKLRLSDVTMIGVELAVVRDADGALHLEGLPFEHAPRADGGGLAGLRGFSLHHSRVSFTNHQGTGVTRTFSDVTFSLQHRAGYLQLHGHALLPDDLGRRIDVDGRLQGLLADPVSWSGRMYLRGQSLALNTLRADLLPQQVPPMAGATDLRLWLDLLDGIPVRWTGELDIDQLELGSKEPYYADRLRTRFGWRRIDEGWQAALQDLRITLGEDIQVVPRVAVTANQTPEGLELDGVSGQLQLQEIAALAGALGEQAGPVGRQLAGLKLRGALNGLKFSLLHAGDSNTLQQFDASFSALGIGPVTSWPGVDGLHGRISGSPEAGALRIETGALVVAGGGLFREPLQFESFDTTLYWVHRDAGLEFDAPALHLLNADLALSGTAGLRLPGSGQSPVLDLQLVVERMNVARVGHYLPAGKMSPTGVAWLDRSLAGGTVTDGSVLIRGPLDKLPFDHGEGRLEVRLPVTGATLAYSPDWTPVTGLDAQVDFTGRAMDIRSRRGRIRSADLQGVRAVIADLQHPHLVITGDVRGALPVMLAELGSSPLGETYGGFVDRMNTRGSAGLGLHIDIPLGKDHVPISVNGRIELNGNRLQPHESEFALEDISGVLSFDDHGIRGDGLTAHLLDRPVRAQVWTDDEHPVTYVTLQGELPLVDQVLAEDAPLRARISGDSAWQVEVITRGQPVRGKPANIDLRLSSQLEGTAIDLPAPLGKAADEARALSIDLRGLESEVQACAVRFGDAVRADLRMVRAGEALSLQRGVIALGGVEPLLPDSRQLLVMGKLARFNLAQWQPLLGDGSGDVSIPLRLSMRLDDLELPGHRLRDIGIEVRSDGRMYTVKTVGTGAEGELRFARSAHGIDDVVANLQHVAVERDDGQTPGRLRKWTPDTFPDLQFSTKRLVYDGTDFGKLELQAAKPGPGQLRVSNLAVSSPMLELRLSGDWREQQGRQFSSVELEIEDGQAGKLLEAFGYQQVIKDGRLSGSLRAGWTGAPWEVEPQRLQGNMKLIIKDGQLLDVDPGAGRMLGLASITALPKRLRLDFSDLFGKGFGFSRIGGNFVLNDGNAWTTDLEIDGPAARIDITGRVGLAHRDYDEQVTVTPSLDSSLPLAGALAGGPAVGAAVLVADKLFEGKLGLNEMARKRYSVTGSWDDPKVTPMEPAPAEQTAADDETGDDFELE